MEFLNLRSLLTLLGQVTGEATKYYSDLRCCMFLKIEIMVLMISKIVSFFWSQDYLLHYLVR